MLKTAWRVVRDILQKALTKVTGVTFVSKGAGSANSFVTAEPPQPPHSLTVQAYREWLALFVLKRLQTIIPSFRWQEVQSFSDIKRILDEYNISWLSILEQERYKLHKYLARVFYDSAVATKHLSKVLEENVK